MSGTPNPEAVAPDASPLQAYHAGAKYLQATLNAQVANALRPAASPKEKQLEAKLRASAQKAKDTHEQLELAEVVAKQTKKEPASPYSWATGRNQQDIANAEASFESARSEHEQAQLTEQTIGLQLTAHQRRARPSIPAFRCKAFDSDTIICDDGSLNDGEKLQQLLEALHAGSERLGVPALTNAQSQRAQSHIFTGTSTQPVARRYINELVTDMATYRALIDHATGDDVTGRI
jgi:hypothetical protein